LDQGNEESNTSKEDIMKITSEDQQVSSKSKKRRQVLPWTVWLKSIGLSGVTRRLSGVKACNANGHLPCQSNG
jgi:hypothetical protein